MRERLTVAACLVFSGASALVYQLIWVRLLGFDYEECSPLAGSGVSQRVAWKNKSLDELAGQVVRLEFLVTKADLYTFHATGNK